MEVKDQPTQNPENLQEEKPQTVETATDKKVTKNTDSKEVTDQISNQEKVQIVNLLAGNEIEASDEVTSASEIPTQLDDNEKEEVIELLKEDKEDTASEQIEVPSTKLPQMNDDEKKDIVNLLQDRVEAVHEKVAEKEGDRLQISQAERMEISALLTGKIAKEAQKAHNLKPDYDKLNKQELVEILEQIVEEQNVQKIREDIAKIKVAFHKRNKEDISRELKSFVDKGGEESAFKPVVGPLEHRYNAAFSQYKRNKLKFVQELEKQKQENLQLKFQILQDLKKLIDSEETLKKTYDEFKILQIRWKEIGMVPASELRNLWQNYHFLVERFFDKVKINKELRDLDMRKNMEIKVALCEKAEELLLEKSIDKSFKLLQKYHDQWREVGPAPTDHREDLWERFKTSTHKINQRRKEHYKELQNEQQTNYEAKVAICDKAEELLVELPTTLNGWHQQTDKMNELLKIWKTIGRAARSQNDEIWARFKSSLDNFFQAKRQFFNKLKEQQMNNYNVKLDLCAQAEALKDSEDWGSSTKALINLQKEWKNSGSVSRRHADKIWKRFRSSCDHFFNRKKEHFKNIHGVEDENYKLKLALIEEIKSVKVSKKKEENLHALKTFQTRWMDIGHVPFKKKDEIQGQYREAIDQLIDQMDINKYELNASGFQNKVDMLKSAPDANRRLSKERGYISGKIRSLEDDLSVLENNIGFFSSSKQSNLLKVEFEKKIENAKNEINSLKDKLKVLDS